MTATTPVSRGRLASEGPAAERIPSRLWVPLAPCDATASGAEDAQVRLTKGNTELALCAHHFSDLEIALAIAGWRVTHDNRGLL